MPVSEETVADVAAQCTVLLLDIEGTTTSISFVKDKLFPYAEEHVHGFLESSWESEEVKQAVAGLRTLAVEDKEREGVVAIADEDAPKEKQVSSVVASVKWLMSQDRKVGELKSLQGLIWQKGYDSGDIKGHVYPDVAEALRAWTATEGRRVCVYSSGSARAQRLLFAHSDAGDLSRHLHAHYDTAVGGKHDADSYRSIAEKIGVRPEQILFLTDSVKEAEAAKSAGLRAALVVREGNAPLPPDVAFPTLAGLAELQPAGAAKRKQHTQEEESEAKIAKVSEEPAAEAAVETMEVDSEQPPGKGKNEEVIEEKVEEVSIEEVAEIEPVPSPIEPTAIEEPSTEVVAVSEPEAPEPESMEAEITEVADAEPAEVIDMVPVVEEPLDAAAEAEAMRSVGDVLEKECDELLSKVKDVTELVTPLLSTISEEPADTASGPVESIDELATIVEETNAAMNAVAEEPTETQVAAPVVEEAGSIEVAASTEDVAERLAANGDEPRVAVTNGEPKETSAGGETNGDAKVEETTNGTETNGDGKPEENGTAKSNGDVKANVEGAGEAEKTEIKVKSVPAADAVPSVEQAVDA